MDWDFTSLTGFIEYREDLQKLTRARGDVNFDFVPDGTHFIQVTLTDDNPLGSLSSFYTIQVFIESTCFPGSTEPECLPEPEGEADGAFLS